MKQGEMIKAMHDWRESMKVHATPTIFINGRKLSYNYRIAELKNVL